VPILGAGKFSWLPFLAAAAMAMSSVTVVSNSLLLGRYKPKLTFRKPITRETELYSSTEEPKQAYIPS
jgi:Cu+-exporting ATPase